MLRICTGLLILATLVPGADQPAIPVSLETGNPAGLVAPGSATPVVVLRNPAGRQVEVRFTATVSEWDGARQEMAAVRSLAAGAEARVEVPLGAGRLGHRQIDYTVQADGRAVPGRASFVYAPPAGQGADPAGFLYSVCSHPERVPAEDAEREMRIAGQIGIGVMRYGQGWNSLEPSPGVWRWEALDRLLAAAERNGLQSQMLLAFCAPHAAPPAAVAAYDTAKAAGRKDAWLITSRCAPDDAAWRRYVAAVVAHCKGRVRLWEVWNEPDLSGFFSGSTDEYIRMLRSAYAEAKRVDPSVQMMTGGFASVTMMPARKLNPDLQERVLAEASDAFDIHAYHEHGLFPGFVQSVDGELKRIRARMPAQRPLYFNETAMHSTFGGERAQALALVKKLVFARARGAIGYTWYDLRNDGFDAGDHEHNYGLVTRDWQPKPVYAVYNQLISRLRGTRFLGELALGGGRYGFAFAGAGRRVALVWNEEPGLPDEPVALTAAGCTAGSSYDLMGNPTPLPTRGGALVIRLRDEPAWIEMPGGEAMPEVVGPLVAVAGNTLVVPGERMALAARLVNPLAEPLGIALAWRNPDGSQARRSLLLAAKARQELSIEALCPADATAAAMPALTVGYQVEGGPWSGDIVVPLRLVQRIPAGDPAQRKPDFTATTAAAVVNFCEADPALKDQTWKGPDDLSLRVWLWRGPAGLRIRAVVRDDIHHQVEDATAAWRGDGLQIGVQVPGQSGFWEVGVALGADGAVLRSVWGNPAGAKAVPAAIVANCSRTGVETLYDVELPYPAFGLTDAVLETGLRCNLIANDNDGPLRKGFIRLAPGIGERKDAAQFPLVRFDRR